MAAADGRETSEQQFREAIGRVIARVELYDEARTETYREIRMRELLDRCRELRTAFLAYERESSADGLPNTGSSHRE